MGQRAVNPEGERFARRRGKGNEQNQRGSSGTVADPPPELSGSGEVQKADRDGGGSQIEHGGERRPFVAGHAVAQSVEREVQGEFVAEGFAADHPGASFGYGGEKDEEHHASGEDGAPPFPRCREQRSGKGDCSRANGCRNRRPQAAVEKFSGEQGADDAGRQKEQQCGEKRGESHRDFSLFFGTGT